ncbi:polyamine transporter 1 [Histoplasma capsulatum var. duboisii H88]|uniref:Polyamine transporter 1 n=1 Tax=Ajellomyces capsulatus (strain H88) TaxID=544711 RepID=A0A8A1LA93_AJEC8|nr:polyamine transporter 1 [Histoplasma capsulatum var. duboisii H88]
MSDAGRLSSTPPEKFGESQRSGSAGSGTETSSEKSLEITAEDPDEIITPQISRRSLPSLSKKVTSVGTTGTTDPNFEVDWDENDPANPRNWPLRVKGMSTAFLSWSTFTVVLYSTSYTAGLEDIAKEFDTSETLVTLGLTLYLIGLAIGSVILAPLSEMYGRRPVSIASLFLFTVFIIPCGLCTSVTELIVLRFLGALSGSAMISSAPGSIADMVDDEHRALAFSIWSIGPLNGPVFGPIIGGYVTQYLGWRWTNWLSIIFGGVALIFMCLMKETYTPVLLQKKAARLREEDDDPRWWSRYDQKASLISVLKTNLSRPFIMAVLEPICIFWNLYIAIVYAILYLCFVAYPIVFREIRGWTVGESGLAFLGIGVGSLTTIAVEPLLRRMINGHKLDPETGKVPPESMVSVVCIAAILVPAGELWFAWTCAPATIHWIAPILAGIPFGMGNTGVFIYASNYLTFSYGVYAASAMAGNSVMRSVLGGVLPLAGPAMYAKLGPNWASTLLGLLEVMIIPIPFVFYKYGHKIRMKSAMIRAMQADKAKLAGKRSKKRRENDGEKGGEEVVGGGGLLEKEIV